MESDLTAVDGITTVTEGSFLRSAHVNEHLSQQLRNMKVIALRSSSVF